MNGLHEARLCEVHSVQRLVEYVTATGIQLRAHGSIAKDEPPGKAVSERGRHGNIGSL